MVSSGDSGVALSVETERVAADPLVLSAAMRIVAEWLLEQSAALATDMPFPQDGVLTPREQEVARLIAGGLKNCEIAERLVITTSTTERHVANILNKLGMRSRAEVAAWIGGRRHNIAT